MNPTGRQRRTNHAALSIMPNPRQRIAIIGTGISGLGCAHFLHQRHDITLYEAADYIGGHTNTVTVTEDGQELPIDTGFMVFNHQT